MSDVQVKEAPPLAPTAPPVPPLLTYKLQERDFVLDETFVYGRSAVTLPLGVAFEDMLRPEFWAHVSYMLRRDAMTGRPDRAGTIISVRTVDHAFYAELYVRAVGDAGLIVGVIREPVYFGSQAVLYRRYEVRWNIGKKGFDVIRRSDRAIIAGAEKFPVREQAEAWIAELEDQSSAA